MDVTDRFVYTVGMDPAAVERHLRTRHTGVLALADAGRAYALPISYVVADDGVYLRLSDDGRAEKFEFLDATAEASLVVYEEGTDSEGDADSWSVVVRGGLNEVDADAAPDGFDVFHVFDEDVADVTLRYFRVDERERSGRRAVGEGE